VSARKKTSAEQFTDPLPASLVRQGGAGVDEHAGQGGSYVIDSETGAQNVKE